MHALLYLNCVLLGCISSLISFVCIVQVGRTRLDILCAVSDMYIDTDIHLADGDSVNVLPDRWCQVWGDSSAW